ncbi:hypothetical protein [Oceanithermus sp.]|uniref:hypothetical protein n=1 Tax=Oceanithermus sp. TaxID=2268145 RepID=UPI00257A9D20|nr:hypothetical protein [Oceanithermus sp.]
MKGIAKLLLLGLLAVPVLSSCGGTPISVPLSDFSININVVADTAGKVVYAESPTEFQESILNVKSITLSGKMTYTTTTGSDTLTLTFYGSADDPAGRNGCDRFGSFYVCDPSGEKAISSQGSFPKGVPTDIALGSPNPEVLAEGINNGRIWIGALVENSLSLNTTFEFTDMVAHVTLF